MLTLQKITFQNGYTASLEDPGLRTKTVLRNQGRGTVEKQLLLKHSRGI